MSTGDADDLAGRSATQLGIVAAKAALIYLTAVFGLRLDERRTLAQWSVIDAAAAVAVCAIQLRLCGLTDDDLYTELRSHGVFDLAAVRYVLFEPTGGLTIVPTSQDTAVELIERGLRTAVAYHPPRKRPTDTGTCE